MAETIRLNKAYRDAEALKKKSMNNRDYYDKFLKCQSAKVPKCHPKARSAGWKFVPRGLEFTGVQKIQGPSSHMPTHFLRRGDNLGAFQSVFNYRDIV